MTETPPDDSEQAFLDRAVVIALGSNLPGAYSSSRELLDAALKALDEYGLKVIRASSWWRSKAWPAGSGPDFLNGIAFVETARTPLQVLDGLQTLEARFGRCRSEQNSPRTLDLDLIAYGRVTASEDGLTVPHDRAADRLFVMGPIAEIAPSWRHPVSFADAVSLAPDAPVGRDAAPIAVPRR